MYSLTHPQIQCMDTLCGMTNIPAKTEDKQLWPATSELSLQNHSLVKNVDEDVVGGFDSCDNNDVENDDDNDDDDVDAGGYQQHVPSNLNYFDLRLRRDVPLFF